MDKTGPIVNGEQFAPGYTPEAAAYEQARRNETVTITPDYDRLRAWMLGVWDDPTQDAFRDAIRDDPATLAWLNPPTVCLEVVAVSVDGSEMLHCHRAKDHPGLCSDWSPEECTIEDCACTEPRDDD